MSLSVTCACGTRLRAHTALARRWSVCPVCGLSVDLRPPERTPRDDPPDADRYVLAPPPPLAAPENPRPDSLPGLPGRAAGRSRSSGRAVPDGVWAALVALPLVLTVLTAVVRAQWLEGDGSAEGWFLVLTAAPLLIVFGYTFGTFQSLMSGAARGSRAQRYWPGGNVARLARSARDGVFAILAGPAMFALAAVLFWIECGDLTWVDELILAQLGLATVAAWLLGFTALTLDGQPRDALPAGVVRTAWRLGRGGSAVLLVGSAGIVWLGSWALGLLEETHRSVGSWVTLLVCWAGLLWWTAGVLYLLASCCHRGKLSGSSARD